MIASLLHKSHSPDRTAGFYLCIQPPPFEIHDRSMPAVCRRKPGNGTKTERHAMHPLFPTRRRHHRQFPPGRTHVLPLVGMRRGTLQGYRKRRRKDNRPDTRYLRQLKPPTWPVYNGAACPVTGAGSVGGRVTGLQAQPPYEGRAVFISPVFG